VHPTLIDRRQRELDVVGRRRPPPLVHLQYRQHGLALDEVVGVAVDRGGCRCLDEQRSGLIDIAGEQVCLGERDDR
jgi:hypothetical protein